MKEAVGESAMTVITILIVAGALAGIGYIIFELIDNQKTRSLCENSGYNYVNGKCTDGINECSYDKNSETYVCGG